MALNALRLAGLAFVSFWFLVGGIGHFVVTETFAGVTPGWVPFPLLVVLGTGVLEIAAAALIWVGSLRRWVGLALIAFCVAVTPVHIEMLMEAERYATLGLPALWGRLLFQPVLIAIIWFVTQPRRHARAADRP